MNLSTMISVAALSLFKSRLSNSFVPHSIRTFEKAARSSLSTLEQPPVAKLQKSNSVSGESLEDTILTEEAWSHYQAIMKIIMNKSKDKNKHKEEIVAEVDTYVSLNQALLDSTVSFPTDNIHDAWASQRKKFLDKTGFTAKHMEFLTLYLRLAGDMFAKRQLPEPAVLAWYKVKESGVVPPEKSFSTFTYALGLSEGLKSICLEVSQVHDQMFKPTETSIYLRVKDLITMGNITDAEVLLNQLSDNEKRLRTFAPYLKWHCDKGNIDEALLLLNQMRKCDGVHLDAETYAILVSAMIRKGVVFPNAASLESLSRLGYHATSGPALLDEVLSLMADDVLELNLDSVMMIMKAFKQDNSPERAGSTAESIDYQCVDTGLRKFCAGRVSISDKNALCPETGVKVRLISLNDEQRGQFHCSLLDLASSQNEDSSDETDQSHGPKRARLAQDARDSLEKFSNWLATRRGEPYTAIVDGANVAFFRCKFFDYKQIQCIVDELESKGERPLVILPRKYTQKSFWVPTAGCFQQLKPDGIKILNRLNVTGKLYVCPRDCLDDYYWMLASVANQKFERSEEFSEGKLPGLRPLLATNDLMRDHKLALLEPRLFRRWFSCHIVNYIIKGRDEGSLGPYACLSPAHLFSREIQANEAIESGHGMVWHFPVAEWPEPERFCIKLLR